MTKIIALTQGKETIVDDEDYEWLMQWKWFFDGRYAIRKLGTKTIYMHREIMKTPVGKDTDHINGDKLYNRHVNLRVCNRSQNMANCKTRNTNTSGYKGVCWDKANSKWQVHITINGKAYKLGRFSSLLDAAHAYDQAALERQGDFAKTNF
jgi:hypothetical protein